MNMRQIIYLEIKNMMKCISAIFYIVFSFVLIINEIHATENKILIKINNQIITSLDIASEVKYLKAINKDYSKLNKHKAIEIAKRSVVNEKIKELELRKIIKELRIDEDFLNNFVVNNFNRLGITSINEFNNFFSSQGLNPVSIKEKITLEILWNQLIYNKFHKNVRIDKQEIKKAIMQNNKQKEYLLSEILFILNNDEKLDDKFMIIKDEINNKNFSQAALSYSISSTNNNGGNLGWVKESVLSPKIKNQINKIQIGEVTDPIIIPGGFLILKVNQSRETKKNLDIEKEMKIVINKKTNEQLNQFSNIYFKKVKKDLIIDEL